MVLGADELLRLRQSIVDEDDSSKCSSSSQSEQYSGIVVNVDPRMDKKVEDEKNEELCDGGCIYGIPKSSLTMTTSCELT